MLDRMLPAQSICNEREEFEWRSVLSHPQHFGWGRFASDRFISVTLLSQVIAPATWDDFDLTDGDRA